MPDAIRTSPNRLPAGTDAGEAARARCVDAVLAADDAAACARVALDWLADSIGCVQGLCAVLDTEAGSLIGLAGRGLPAEALAGVRADLAERNHPLVLSLSSTGPVELRSDPRSGAALVPLAGPRFVAAPLLVEAGGERDPVGLLCLAACDLEAPAIAEIEWASRLLATRLASMRLRREREVARRSQRRVSWLAELLHVVSDPILLTDDEGRSLFANRAAEYLLSSDEDMSEGRRRAVAMNNMLYSAAAFAAHDAGRGRREMPLVDPVDGNERLYELIAHRLDLGDGEDATVSVLVDVSDLQRAVQEMEANFLRARSAEGRIRAERDRLELILASTVDPILVTDVEGGIELMNPPAERLFGAATTSAAEERRVRGNYAVLTSFLSKLYADSSRRLREHLHLGDPASGDAVPVEAIATRVEARRGEGSAIVTVMHDLTETMERAALYEQVKEYSERLEERVREATAELAQQNELLHRQSLQVEQASAMKSQFLANASHELRTPLNAIIGHSHMLIEGIAGELSAAQIDKLERLDANARHLLTIIDDLLDISRIEAGKLSLRVERFSLADLVAEVMAEIEPLANDGRVDVRGRVSDALPSIESDRKKVKQIIVNLLSNALKFTAEGSISVTAYHDRDAGTVGIAVSDTGVGIRPEHQATIFEPFGQSESAFRPHQKSTGLGLSICRRLATLLGGDISLESTAGEGSTFVLELPLEPGGDEHGG